MNESQSGRTTHGVETAESHAVHAVRAVHGVHGDLVRSHGRRPATLGDVLARSRVTAVAAGLALAFCSANNAGTLPRVGPACFYDHTVISSPPHQSGIPIILGVRAMNDLGEVLGHRNLLGGHVPFYWSAEEGVVPMPLPAGTSTSVAIAINNNGWILIDGHGNYGGARGFIVPPEVRLFPSAWIRIDPVDPSIPFSFSYVRGINDKNEVVGHRSSEDLPPMSPFPHWGYWWSPTSGGPVNVVIEGPEGNDSNGLRSINDSGVMLGWTSNNAHWTQQTQSWRVDDDGVTGLPAPDRGVGAAMIPMAINGHGDALVIEQIQYAPGLANAVQKTFVMRSNGEVVDCPPVGDHLWANGVSVNDAGVVGGRSRTVISGGNSTATATIWFDGVPVDANDLVDVPQSLVGVFHRVEAVNNCGQILIGGQTGGLLLTPAGVFGDLDCDGLVGLSDLALLLTHWAAEGTRADLDESGIVDGADLGQLLTAWSR